MSLSYDLATTQILWRRDLLRFFRRKSRLLGALIQPLLFWLLIGGGMASTFRLEGVEGLDYESYFFPGILVMMVLFAAIFGTITVIEDRHQGFLQSVLVAPSSRGALVLGKTLGVASVGLVQGGLFLLLAPWAGFPFAAIDWPLLLLGLSLGAVSLSALGFALAWWLDSSQAYHAIMSALLLPGWILSGAMFPLSAEQPVLSVLMRWNPMSYIVEVVRGAFYPGGLPAGLGLGVSSTVAILVLGAFTLSSLAWATWICYRRR